MSASKQQIKTQYIIQYKPRFKPDEWWTISSNPATGKLIWSHEEALRVLERIKREEMQARKRGCTTSYCGGLVIDCAHYTEYDHIAYRIRKREVTPYETIFEENVE